MLSRKVTKIFEEVRAEERKFLIEHEAKKICKEYGIPLTKLKIAKSAEEAADFSEEISYPTVPKIVSTVRASSAPKPKPE
jgi:acyl-CoA synthetase (NDP forming)